MNPVNAYRTLHDHFEFGPLGPHQGNRNPTGHDVTCFRFSAICRIWHGAGTVCASAQTRQLRTVTSLVYAGISILWMIIVYM